LGGVCNDYEISLEGRGELIRYTQGGRRLEAEVTWGAGCTLYTWPARHWRVPEGVPVAEGDLKVAVDRMVQYLVRSGSGPVAVVDAAPESEADRLERLRREGFDVYLQEGRVIYKRDQFVSTDDLKKRR